MTAEAYAVSKLGLRQFRSYRRLDLEIEPGVVVLYGENGAGKTNLLEAISLLSPGRGLRQAKTRDLDYQGREPWTMQAEVSGHEGPREVATGHDPERERRYVELDGRKRGGSAALAELGGMLWLTPAQDRLFLDGPSGRRRFLDRLVLLIDPEHAGRVQLYERSLRERSILLRQGRADDAWLTVLETRLASLGVAIVSARRQLVDSLAKHLDWEASPFPAPRLALEGELEAKIERLPAAAVEAEVAASLRAGRSADAQAGGAAIGAHRGDLLVVEATSGQRAESCSTGQQKALLVRLILAAAALAAELTGVWPIMLLDEIGAHLDHRRRHELADELDATGAQAWLSGTERELFSALKGRAHYLRIHASEVRHDG